MRELTSSECAAITGAQNITSVDDFKNDMRAIFAKHDFETTLSGTALLCAGGYYGAKFGSRLGVAGLIGGAVSGAALGVLSPIIFGISHSLMESFYVSSGLIKDEFAE
jgi:hypothetical protein